MTITYDKSLTEDKQVVKSVPQGNPLDLALKPGCRQPGTLIRAERAPGEVAVSEVYGEGRGELHSLPGTPKTNSEPSVKSGGSSIDGPGPLRGGG